MRKLLTTLWLAISSLAISFQAFSQVRPDISTLTGTQQTQLANLIMQYITPTVLESHCNYHAQTGQMNLDIHDDVNFLPFHRAYIEGLEDFLLQQGFPQYVPLPKWNPATCAPSAFQVVDQTACNAAPCMMGMGGNCNLPSNWCPNVARPSYLSLPTQAGSNNDLCDWALITGSSGLSRVIEGELPNAVNSTYHNSVHNNMGGVMAGFRSPATPAFWIWHAYVDDLWKERQCNCGGSPQQVDLYIKDTKKIAHLERDLGAQPNTDNGPMWESDDIWVRTTNDGFTNHTHQNPEYVGSNPVRYVYVRVRNRGCATTTGNESINLYWAKASSGLSWPAPWTNTSGNPQMGGAFPAQTVGTTNSIAAGDERIFEFAWTVPNPVLYGTADFGPDSWHFCLLARVVASNDPMFNEVNNDLHGNVKRNNNIAWKNITVTDIVPGIANPGGVIAVGNFTASAETFNLSFENPQGPGTKVTDEAEVRIKLGNATLEKWIAGGSQSTNMKLARGTEDEFIVTGSPAALNNLTYNAGEWSQIFVGFSFLTEEVDPNNHEYDFHVIQKIADEPFGGEKYHIVRASRTPFYANAGADQLISPADQISITAQGIAESAEYKWYNEQGELLHNGQTLTVAPTVSSKYTLEVLSNVDGYRDYDEVQVNVRQYWLQGLTPNPASGQVTVSHATTGATSAYITIMQPYTSVSTNYTINPADRQTSINLAGYTPGTYSVILVCNGQAVDSKQLVIQ